MSNNEGPLDITFTATLGRVRAGDTWTWVQLPGSAAILGTRGLVKVTGAVDGEPFHGAFMALGDGTHKLQIRWRLEPRSGPRVSAQPAKCPLAESLWL